MKKIKTLFRRDPNNMARVLPAVSEGCEWVLAGEGVATAKVDGACTKLSQAKEWWARREVKKDGVVPENFVAVQHDPVTGKTVGWEPIGQSSFVKLHRQALADADRDGFVFTPGTFELCGPKINKNPVQLAEHRLIRHGSILLDVSSPTYEDLRDWLLRDDFGYEGIVWWREPGNPNSDMVKLKARDFR